MCNSLFWNLIFRTSEPFISINEIPLKYLMKRLLVLTWLERLSVEGKDIVLNFMLDLKIVGNDASQ